MSAKLRVYLAGQKNEHDNNWKKCFDGIDCSFHDWEIHSDQTSPDTFFPDDLKGIQKSDFLIANPGIAPSEATWIEVGYFYSINTSSPGDFCKKLIIVWPDAREPRWSIEFVRKAGFVVRTVDEAVSKLKELLAK